MKPEKMIFFALQSTDDALGIANPNARFSHILLRFRNSTTAMGRIPVPPHTWTHVVLVCDHGLSSVFVNASRDTSLDGHSCADEATGLQDGSSMTAYLGGLAGKSKLAGTQPFEGRLDEVAFYSRPLDEYEVARHLQASGDQVRSAVYGYAT